MLPAKVAEIDAAIQRLDRILLKGTVRNAPRWFMEGALSARNQLTRDWGKEVGTKQVAS